MAPSSRTTIVTSPAKPMSRAPSQRTLRAVQYALAILLFAAGLPALALDESVIRAPVVRGVEQASIEVTVFKPEGVGPFPIVVLSHGSPRSRSEEHTSELHHLVISYAVFCLKTKTRS